MKVEPLFRYLKRFPIAKRPHFIPQGATNVMKVIANSNVLFPYYQPRTLKYSPWEAITETMEQDTQDIQLFVERNVNSVYYPPEHMCRPMTNGPIKFNELFHPRNYFSSGNENIINQFDVLPILDETAINLPEFKKYAKNVKGVITRTFLNLRPEQSYHLSNEGSDALFGVIVRGDNISGLKMLINDEIIEELSHPTRDNLWKFHSFSTLLNSFDEGNSIRIIKEGNNPAKLRYYSVYLFV